MPLLYPARRETRRLHDEMTQPRFAPIQYEDEVRPGYRLAPPVRWVADRPADYTGQPTRFRHGEGVHGPDQGYALLLAERIVDRLVLASGEHLGDVVTACVAIALRRAAIFGRAPVLADLEVAYGLLGYLSDAPAALVSARGVSSSTGQSMTTGRFAISLRGRQKRCCANRRQRSRARRKDGARSTDSITARQRTRLSEVESCGVAGRGSPSRRAPVTSGGTPSRSGNSQIDPRQIRSSLGILEAL